MVDRIALIKWLENFKQNYPNFHRELEINFHNFYHTYLKKHILTLYATYRNTTKNKHNI